MTLSEQILGQLAIPALLAILLIYYAVKLLVFKDVDAVRPASKKPLKDKDGYAKEAGLLVLIFGVCSAVMAGIMLVSAEIGLLFIIAVAVVVFLRFKKLEEKYT